MGCHLGLCLSSPAIDGRLHIIRGLDFKGLDFVNEMSQIGQRPFCCDPSGCWRHSIHRGAHKVLDVRGWNLELACSPHCAQYEPVMNDDRSVTSTQVGVENIIICVR